MATQYADRLAVLSAAQRRIEEARTELLTADAILGSDELPELDIALVAVRVLGDTIKALKDAELLEGI